MREYYGELIDGNSYRDDKRHKAIPLKKGGFNFELNNDTEYLLKVSIGHENSYENQKLIEPKGKIFIRINNYMVDIFVSTKENGGMKCNFTIEAGCMVKRNADKYIVGKPYIVPIFKNGKVTIVNCKDCRPNLGVKTKYKITTLKNAKRKLEVRNCSPYDIIISINNNIIQKIEGRKVNKEPSSKYIKIPESGILYIDTLSEEIFWKDEYNIYGDSIIKVNGCQVEYTEKSATKVTIPGPGSTEPYIHHLYVSPNDKYFNSIDIWYNTIDFRFD